MALLLARQLLVFPFCLHAATAALVSTPSSVNATLGSTVTFNCNVTIGSVVWIVNGSILPELRAPDITASQLGSIFILHIPATEKYNNTNVTCGVAILGGEDLYSDPVVLKVQGLLSAVSDLVALPQKDVISLTWTPPFSLDITGVDLDLWYKMEVYNVTSGAILTSAVVYMSEFNFTILDHNPCNQFEFRVTPVNGAGVGTTSEPTGGYFLRRPMSIQAAGVEVMFTIISCAEKNIILTFHTIPVCVGKIPEMFRVHVEAYNDGISPPPHSFTVTSFAASLNYTNETTILTFQALDSDLPPNRLYNVVIEAENRAGGTNSTGVIQLSTYDVQTATASSSPDTPGTVTVLATFAVNSLALGFLVILVDTRGTAVSLTSTLRPNHTAVISGLASADSYTVVVFDVENTGLPSTSAAAVDVVNVTSTEPVTAPLNSATDNVQIELLPNGTVCVTCSFTAGSDSQGCVTLLLSASDLTRIEVLPIPKVDSLLRTEVCLNVTMETNHTIAVFDWENGGALGAHPVKIQHLFMSLPPAPTGPIHHNDTEHLSACSLSCIIGIAVGGLILSVVVSTVCGIMVAAVKKCKGKPTVSEVGAAVKIPMQTNTAYESHQLSSRHPPPQMESCAAYRVVGRQ